MMFIAKLFFTAAAIYGAARLSVLAIRWMKKGFDDLSEDLSPDKYDD